MDKWERQLERRRQQREYQRRQSEQRAELRPLRNAVNKAMKDAGIKHSKTHYSSRVKGWPLSTSEGWETESIFWSDPKYIQLQINIYHSSFSKSNNVRLDELCQIAEAALIEGGFDYKRDGAQFEIYSRKNQ